MSLIYNWKDAWKWFSVHAGALIAVLSTVQMILPGWQEFMEPNPFALTTAVLGTLVILGRVVKQDA